MALFHGRRDQPLEQLANPHIDDCKTNSPQASGHDIHAK
jgi:hypothetical protein